MWIEMWFRTVESSMVSWGCWFLRKNQDWQAACDKDYLETRR